MEKQALIKGFMIVTQTNFYGVLTLILNHCVTDGDVQMTRKVETLDGLNKQDVYWRRYMMR